jgi:hypothetical protein
VNRCYRETAGEYEVDNMAGNKRSHVRGSSGGSGKHVTLATLLWSLLLAGHVSAQQSVAEREAARVETIRRITPSVVCVMAPNGEGGGSGVLISADGYAISNYHVTSG